MKFESSAGGSTVQPGLRTTALDASLTTKVGSWDQWHGHHENIIRNAEPQAPPKPTEPETAFPQGPLIGSYSLLRSLGSLEAPFQLKNVVNFSSAEKWMKHVLKIYLVSHY